MLPVTLSLDGNEAPKILFLGAHSDDIEIGAGATVLWLAQRYPGAKVTWVVLSGVGQRKFEAQSSAEYFTAGFDSADIRIHQHTDGMFPSEVVEIKAVFEDLKRDVMPDVVFTHYRKDLHQDHRTVSDVTWQTFRNHLVLEYEIPKFDGDLASPNWFVPVSDESRSQKKEGIERYFQSQKDRSWFTAQTFDAVMRIRGIECNSPTGFAEAFYCRKIVAS